MIRFNCTSCGRQYDLLPALTGLRILCKKCGAPLTVPEPTGDPDPPEPVPPPPPPTKAKAPAPPPPAEPDDEVPLTHHPRWSPDVDSDAPAPTAAVPPPARPSRPPVPPTLRPAPPTPVIPPTRGRNLLAVVADVAVGLILLAGGVLLGEMLAGKGTAAVWRDAGAAVTFPPEELVVWAGPPAVALLGYGLLAAKGLSVGGWLRRRATR